MYESDMMSSAALLDSVYLVQAIVAHVLCLIHQAPLQWLSAISAKESCT